MTSNALRKELFELSRAEKLEVVEELWDDIATDSNAKAAELTVAQHEDLDRQVREMNEHPERGRPWEEVRERIRQRRR